MNLNLIGEKLEEIGNCKSVFEKINHGVAQQVTAQMIKYLDDLEMLTGSGKEIVEVMTTSEYWNIIGKNKYPLLYNYAKKINVMTCSSASAERVWSIFGFLHKPLRNRLSNDKVEKLVFLYVNSALLDDIDKNDYISADHFSLNEDDFTNFAA